ncbi:MAG: hypothetical protein GY800_08240 [Planctomycetes bacterium]|nr:hypothetical protein [Planctomycetota bacterium]
MSKQRKKIPKKKPEPERKGPVGGPDEDLYADAGPDADIKLDIDREIEQGLRAIAAKAREGDPQALKLLLAYREGRKDDAGDAHFSDLTEIERRTLKSAIIREIISLREEVASIRGDCGGA